MVSFLYSDIDRGLTQPPEPAQIQAVKSDVVPALIRLLSGPREVLLSNVVLFSYSCRLLDLLLILRKSIPQDDSNLS
jgi:hypothetical protein